MLTQEATQLTLGSTLSIENPRPRGFPGFPFCLRFRPLLGAVKSRRAKLEEQKCSPSAEGFLFACAGPRGCAPLEPQAGGAPCTARLTAPPAEDPAGSPLAEGQGCRGKSAPTPCRQAWVAPVASRGRVLAFLRGCGPHQPLDPPSTRKTRHRPAQGLEGALSEWMGVKARAATRAAAWP